MKILVTGSAGFIGYHLCRDLLSSGHQVIGVDKFTEDYPVSLKEKNNEDLKKYKNFEFHKFDILNEGIASIFGGREVDYFVHLAAKDLYYGNSDRIEFSPYLETNVVGAAKAFELAKIVQAKKFIMASTHSIYGITKKGVLTEKNLMPKPVSPHGASKLAAELVLRFMSSFYDLPVVVLRIFSVYGPGMRPHTFIPRVIDRLQNNRPLELYTEPDQMRDYIYIDDVVNYIKSTFNKRIKFQTINVAGGESLALPDVAKKISKLLGKSDLEVVLNRSSKDFSRMQIKHVQADTSRAKKLLQYTPEVSFDVGLKKTVDWYLDNPEILNLSVP